MRARQRLPFSTVALCLLPTSLWAAELEPIAAEHFREAVLPKQLVLEVAPVILRADIPLSKNGEARLVWARDARHGLVAWAPARNEVDAARIALKYSREYREVGIAMVPLPVLISLGDHAAKGEGDEEETCQDYFSFWEVDEDGDYVPDSEDIGCADDGKPAE